MSASVTTDSASGSSCLVQCCRDAAAINGYCSKHASLVAGNSKRSTAPSTGVLTESALRGAPKRTSARGTLTSGLPGSLFANSNTAGASGAHGSGRTNDRRGPIPELKPLILPPIDGSAQAANKRNSISNRRRSLTPKVQEMRDRQKQLQDDAAALTTAFGTSKLPKNLQESLQVLLRQRPTKDDLRRKHIIPEMTSSDRARTLATLLKQRSTEEQLKSRHIIHQNPDEFHKRAESLSELLRRRPDVDQMHQKGIILSPRSPAEKHAIAGQLQGLLKARPTPELLVERHIIDVVPHSEPAAATQRRRRVEFIARQQSLDWSLQHRPTPDILTKLASTSSNGASIPESEEEPDPQPRKLRPSLSQIRIDQIISLYRKETTNDDDDDSNVLDGREKRGAVLVWGEPDKGILGMNRVERVSYKDGCQPIRDLFKESVVEISCGGFHTVLRTASGELYSWGANTYGQLGLGDLQNRQVPFLVNYRKSSLHGIRFRSLAAGINTSAFVTEDDRVLICGNHTDGMLGVNDSAQGSVRSVPSDIPSLAAKGIVTIALGYSHAAALTSNGDLYTWGRGDEGQLGHGDTVSQASPKLLNKFVEFFSSVSLGQNFSAAVAYDGNVYTWGLNDKGQCGNQAARILEPKVATNLWRKSISKVCCGESHTAALSDDGDVFVSKSVSDIKMAGFEVKGERHLFKDLAAGGRLTVGISANRGVYTWEKTATGEVVPYSFAPLENKVTQVTCGVDHFATLTERHIALAEEEIVEEVNERRRSLNSVSSRGSTRNLFA